MMHYVTRFSARFSCESADVKVHRCKHFGQCQFLQFCFVFWNLGSLRASEGLLGTGPYVLEAGGAGGTGSPGGRVRACGTQPLRAHRVQLWPDLVREAELASLEPHKPGPVSPAASFTSLPCGSSSSFVSGPRRAEASHSRVPFPPPVPPRRQDLVPFCRRVKLGPREIRTPWTHLSNLRG